MIYLSPMKLQTLIPANQSFTRLVSDASAKEHMKEALRVGYIVKVEKDTDDFGNDQDHAYSFTIWDDETGDVVMQGLRPSPDIPYATRFSKLYWEEPRL